SVSASAEDAADDAAEDAARDLVADLAAVLLPGLAGDRFADAAAHAAADRAADVARGLLGHRLDHALAAPGAEQELADLLADAAFAVLLRRRSAGGRAGLHPGGQHFRGRLAVDGRVVAGADRAASAHPGPLGLADRSHAAARRRDLRHLHWRWDAACLQGADQGLARSQLG